MVPNGWKRAKVSELLKSVDHPIKLKPAEIYREIGIRSHAKGIFHKEPVSGASLGEKRVFRVIPDCLVLNIVFAWEQAVARTTNSEADMIASHRFPMFKPNNGACNIDYILYFFKTEKGKSLLGMASPGGAGRNKTLGKKEFANLEILVPPITEQVKIVQILSSWDCAIITTERLLDNCKQQKKSLTRLLMTESQRFPGFIGDWTYHSFADIANITMGSAPKSGAYNNAKVGLPLIQGNADIQNRRSAPRIFTSEITKQCDIGDILLSVRAPVGTVAKSEHHACIGRGICSLQANSVILQDFLYQWLLWFEPCWARLSQGSTFESINSSDIYSLKLKAPTEQEQHKISQILTAADQEIRNLQAKITCLKQEKNALMQQLLTGKRRVKVDALEVA